ncbi:MAG: NAD-dependent epimerase/dehydratase family protein [Pseudomonadota bacterium]
MKILVTGGGGFLGRGVIRALQSEGHELATLNRSAYPDLEQQGTTCHRGDIGDADAVMTACSRMDAVIHVAAKAGPGLYRPDFVRANVDGTRHVLAACRAHGIRYLVHTSSPSVVHQGGDIEGGNEGLPLAEHFPAPYPETKAEAERMVLAANDGKTLLTTALRPHLIWGPGDNHLLPRMIQRNRAGRLKLPAPDKRIDTVYIDNAADAHVLALKNLMDSASAAGKAYFITNHEPMANGEIIRALLEAAGEQPNIGSVSADFAMNAARVVEAVWKPLRIKSDPPISTFLVEHLATAHWFDLGAAKRDLNYQPKVSMEEGLQRLAAHFGKIV